MAKFKLNNKKAGLILAFLLLLVSPYARSQYDFDEIEDQETGQLQLFGGIKLRADAVRDLPRPIEKDFERAMAQVRFGGVYTPNELLEIGATAKINLSTQSNNKVRFNLDNEKADDLSLDELYLKFNISATTQLTLGQQILPLELSPMVWDDDLRPQGVSIRHSVEFGQFNSAELVAGSFLGNHLFGDDTKINAVQGALRFGEGKNTGIDVITSYIDFSDIDDLGPNSLGRTNFLNASGRHLNDFNLLDLQVKLHFNQHTFPITAKMNIVDNLAVGEKSTGARIDFVVGDSFQQKGLEIGIATQRVQDEAILAAFNDDDWWFASSMRGTSAWVGYGFNDTLRIRLAGFNERLDRAIDHNKRLLLDLEWFF